MITARIAKQIRRGILDGRADTYIFPDTPEGRAASSSFPHYVRAFHRTKNLAHLRKILAPYNETRNWPEYEQKLRDYRKSIENPPKKDEFGQI